MFDADPHAVAAAHRASSAALYDDEQQAWLVLRHVDVATMLRDPNLRKDPAAASDGPYTRALLADDHSMLFKDDPDHRRLRSLVSQAFSKRATEASRPRIQTITDAILDAIEVEADSVDIVSSLAVPLPIMVIAEILGVESTDIADFKRWSDDMALSFDPTLSVLEAERVAASDVEFRDYVAGAIRARRDNPHDDLISGLVAAQDEDGSQLSDAEAISAVALLMFAGNATTTDLIANGLFALLQNPDQLSALQSDPSLIVNAVEEMLRYDPPIAVGDRITVTDFDLDGCPIKSGQWLWLALSSANRDPAFHSEPDRFDIQRDPVHQVSFGGGRHLCLGAPLARIETQIAVSSLITRFPRIRLADPSNPPSYKYVPGFHGLADLRVVLT